MHSSRRQFFFKAIGLISIGLASSLVRAEERRRARPGSGGNEASGPLGQPLVDQKDPVAQAMNYNEKHSDVKKAEIKVEKSGVPFEKQHCGNCGFYKEVGTKEGTKVGTCTIFSGKLVKSEAWCTSWNKKA